MTEVLASACVERVTGQSVDVLEPLTSGQSSRAWRARVGEQRWVVRVPIPGSDRRITYRAEAEIGELLASLGHPVADWTLVSGDRTRCSVAPEIVGAPVGYDAVWSSDFARALGALLGDLHALPADRYGPLADRRGRLRGLSDDPIQGVTDRWCHAPIWPFDGSSIADHAIGDLAPDLAAAVGESAGHIIDAASGPVGAVHSDLHREHLLVADDGSLAGVLDFGDAVIGSTAWDFALLCWYSGRANATLVARHAPDGADTLDRGVRLSIAVGLYKVAKNPGDPAVIVRLRRLLEWSRSA